jgi:secretion/DNA translocation related TadE-like protein
MTSSRTDEGSVSVLALAAAIGLLAVVPLAGSVSAAIATKHRLDAAADLAALAAAYDVGVSDPCATAQRVASANAADVEDCVVDDPSVTVTVVPDRPLVGVPVRIASTARAALE